MKVAVALWCGGFLISLIGYAMIGLYPPGILFLWAFVGLAELVLASLIGCWVYRERPA